MIHKKVAIITCFSYKNNKKYALNPHNIRTDLFRVIKFVIHKMKCTYENIYVLTDLLPDKNKPSKFTLSDILEFVYENTNYKFITNAKDYEHQLINILNDDITELFFYYSGHGIKHSLQSKIYLLIPEDNMYPNKRLQKIFNNILKNVSSFMIFDCCYSEEIFTLPYKLSLNNSCIIYSDFNLGYGDSIIISSTRNNQTCGFHISGGSLFTHYLMTLLESYNISTNNSLSDLKDIEHKIQHYRTQNAKTPQNITISLTDIHITNFPYWLF